MHGVELRVGRHISRERLYLLVCLADVLVMIEAHSFGVFFASKIRVKTENSAAKPIPPRQKKYTKICPPQERTEKFGV